MEETDKQIERRRYYRIAPSAVPKPRARLEIGGKEYQVEVLNLSPGGLLCYVPDMMTPIGVDQIIPKIEIKLPEMKPVIYAGRVIRLQRQPERDQRFCAIEFVQFDRKILKKGTKPYMPFREESRDQQFLQRLRSLPRLRPELPLEEELRVRENLFDAFAEEAKCLPLEERWYFYEVLEEMKWREPNYPPGLKEEFIRLCRGEDRSEFYDVHGQKSGKKGWLKKIWPFG